MWTSASKIGGTPGATYLRRRHIWERRKWPESVRWIGHRVGIKGLPGWSAGCVIYGYTDPNGVVAGVALEALDKDGWRGDELGRNRWQRYCGRKSGCAFRVGNGRACIYVVTNPEAALVLGTQHGDGTILATANGDAGYADVVESLQDVTVPIRIIAPPGGNARLAAEAAAICGAEIVQARPNAQLWSIPNLGSIHANEARRRLDMHRKRSGHLLGMLGLVALVGCATPMPALTDFTGIKAEVKVPYDESLGPRYEESRIAADPIGAEHCESLGKKAVFVSGRTEITGANTTVTPVHGSATPIVTSIGYGTHVFLYRCEENDDLGGTPPSNKTHQDLRSP